MVRRPAASAEPGNSQGTQMTGPHSEPTESEMEGGRPNCVRPNPSEDSDAH